MNEIIGTGTHVVAWVDQELEECVKTCHTNQKTPPVIPLHPWDWPNKPWSCVHIDYCGPFQEKCSY